MLFAFGSVFIGLCVSVERAGQSTTLRGLFVGLLQRLLLLWFTFLQFYNLRKNEVAYIITIIAIVLASIFAILVKVWAGFMYFVLASLLLLSLFWGVWLIIQYFSSFKLELEERFKIFKANVINANQLTTEQFNQNEQIYRKDFSKKMLKDKFIKWFVIAFCFSLAVAFLMAMILM